MSEINKDTVTKIAKLARIHLDDADKEPMAKELSGIFKFIEQLQEVDTKNVAPMTGVAAMTSVLRVDVVSDGNIKDDLLKNAPDAAHGFFTVPKVVE